VPPGGPVVAGFADAEVLVFDSVFVERLAGNPLAREVKMADLEDNMDIRRLEEITDRDVTRLRTYLRAWKFLSNCR